MFIKEILNSLYGLWTLLVLVCVCKSMIRPQIKSPPQSHIAGLCQVWRQITVSAVLPQEEIPEASGIKVALTLLFDFQNV